MKHYITFKTPDVVQDLIDEICTVYADEDDDGTDDYHDRVVRPALDAAEVEAARVDRLLKKYVAYGENVTLEIDTDAGTVSVKKL